MILHSLYSVEIIQRGLNQVETIARIFKLLRFPRIDSKESIPPAYEAWRAGTATLYYFYSAPIDFLKIPSQTIKQGFSPSLGDPIVLLIQTKNTYYPSDMIDR